MENSTAGKPLKGPYDVPTRPRAAMEWKSQSARAREGRKE